MKKETKKKETRYGAFWIGGYIVLILAVIAVVKFRLLQEGMYVAVLLVLLSALYLISLAVWAKELDYVIIRTYSAGVFAGFLKARRGPEVDLVDARRLWQWHGAATLSQMAVDGTSKPELCKFPCEVPTITLLGVIEIIPASGKAKESIRGVAIWRA